MQDTANTLNMNQVINFAMYTWQQNIVQNWNRKT